MSRSRRCRGSNPPQSLVLRAAPGVDEASLLEPARRTIVRVAPGVAVQQTTTMGRVLDVAIGPARQVVLLLSLLTALALVVGRGGDLRCDCALRGAPPARLGDSRCARASRLARDHARRGPRRVARDRRDRRRRGRRGGAHAAAVVVPLWSAAPSIRSRSPPRERRCWASACSRRLSPPGARG